jgi:hypothetical protein
MNTFTIQLLDDLGYLLIAIALIGGFLLLALAHKGRRIAGKEIVSGADFDRLFVVYLTLMSITSFLWSVAGFAHSNPFKGVMMALMALLWATWATYKWVTRRAYN